MISYGLDTRFGKALSAQVFVNDVLQGAVESGDDTFQSLAIQQDVVRGANRIDVLITVASAAGGSAPVGDADTMFAEMYLEIDKVRDIGDSYEITTNPVAQREWRAQAGGPVQPHQRIVIDWTAVDGMTDPVWVRAQVVPPERAIDLVAAELEALRKLLAARQIDEFQTRLRYRNEDMARAYPMTGSATKRAAADSEMLDGLLPDVPLFAPIDRARLHLRPMAGGRIFACTADDGQPPLRCAVPGGEPIYISATFAMLDGQMVVVR